MTDHELLERAAAAFEPPGNVIEGIARRRDRRLRRNRMAGALVVTALAAAAIVTLVHAFEPGGSARPAGGPGCHALTPACPADLPSAVLTVSNAIYQVPPHGLVPAVSAADAEDIAWAASPQEMPDPAAAREQAVLAWMPSHALPTPQGQSQQSSTPGPVWLVGYTGVCVTANGGDPGSNQCVQTTAFEVIDATTAKNLGGGSPWQGLTFAVNADKPG